MSSFDKKITNSLYDFTAPVGFGVLAEIIILIIGITLTIIYYPKMNKSTRITAIVLLSLSPLVMFGIILLSIKILLDNDENK